MRKMLIAVYSRIITEKLIQTFQSSYQIYTCSQGDDALSSLQCIKPDVLIIMLSLPGITGIEVLQQTAYTPPVIIALTDFLSDSVVREAQNVGVGSIIRLPCSTESISHHLSILLERQEK